MHPDIQIVKLYISVNLDSSVYLDFVLGVIGFDRSDSCYLHTEAAPASLIQGATYKCQLISKGSSCRSRFREWFRLGSGPGLTNGYCFPESLDTGHRAGQTS